MGGVDHAGRSVGKLRCDVAPSRHFAERLAEHKAKKEAGQDGIRSN
jgi:hypothetical protein